MKIKTTLLAAFIAAFFTGFAQQIPNGSFENWTNTYTPTGWVGWEDILNGNSPVSFPPDIWTFKDTATYTNGSASIKLVSDSIPGHKEIFNGLISLGSGVFNSGVPIFSGIPFTYRPDTIIFDYQFQSPNADTAGVFISLTNSGNVVLGILVKPGVTLPLYKAHSWTHMAIPITRYYQNSTTPDTLLLQFTASYSSKPVSGSVLLVDNVSFGYAAPQSGSINAVITSAATNVCNGDSILLTANTGNNYSYQWNFNGSPIANATLVTYYAKAAGSYTVTIDSATLTGTSQALVITANCNVIPVLTATITGTGSNVCNGDSVLLASNTGANYHYQWVLGSTPIAGATTPDYYAKTPGFYTVVIDSANDTAISLPFVVTDTGCVSGISNVVAVNFLIYPNPASTVLNINSGQNLAGVNLQVYDLTGNLVANPVLTGTNNVINVSALGNGIYFYRITGKDNSFITQNKFSIIK